MESTGREKEKEKEKGRWREENGGPVKCRWRVLGRVGVGVGGSGVTGGGGWGGLSSLFFPFREHPLLFSIVPLCDSWSWQCEGENKNELAVQPGSVAASDATPPSKSLSQPGGPQGLNLKQNTLRLTQQFFFFQHPQKLLNTRPWVWCSSKTKIICAFCCFMCFLFCFLKKDYAKQGRIQFFFF